MAINFTTPTGRLVQGDPYTAQPRRDATGKPKIYPAGHINAGQPETQFFAAVAIPKTDPAWPAFRELLAAEARLAWPQFHDANGVCTNPTFADKITDGDGKDEKGQPHSAKAGFAGCWVVKCASAFAPRVVEYDAVGWVDTAPGKVKLGDYVRINGSVTSNNSAQSPGMYMNLSMIAFDREGERIVFGPTAEQAFGTPGAPVVGAAPGGAAPPPPSSGPTMTAKAGAFTYAQMIAQGWTDATLIEHGYMTAAAPPPPAAPSPPAAPAAPPAPRAPPAPPYDGHMKTGPTMTAKAGAFTYDQMVGQGWTDTQLIEQGYMVAPAA